MSDGPSVEAVLFDLDGTLCRYRRSPGEVLAVAFERVGVDPLFEVEAYYDAFDRFAADADGMADLRERCFAALATERGHDPDRGRAVARAFAAERDHRDVVARPGVLAALDRLSDRYALGVVTNGPRDAQTAKLDGLGRRGAFDAVVCAGETVPAKPAVDPFERALSALDVAPGEAAFVGDSVETDVAGANAAGLRSVLVGTDGEADARATDARRPDYRVDGLDDLAGLPICRP